jgi:hypothetical protein
VEFGVKIPQVFDVQSARAALQEILGGNGKLKRYDVRASLHLKKCTSASTIQHINA